LQGYILTTCGTGDVLEPKKIHLIFPWQIGKNSARPRANICIPVAQTERKEKANRTCDFQSRAGGGGPGLRGATRPPP